MAGCIAVVVVFVGMFTEPHFIDQDKTIKERLEELIVQENE